MNKLKNNGVPNFPEEEYRRLYKRVYGEVYQSAYQEGYKDGKEDGYNKGYEHDLKDHHYNEQARAQNRLTYMRWHGRNSKSWSWI